MYSDSVGSYGGTQLRPTVNVLPICVHRSNINNIVHAGFQGTKVHLDLAVIKVYQVEHANGEFNLLVMITSIFMYVMSIRIMVYY